MHGKQQPNRPKPSEPHSSGVQHLHESRFDMHHFFVPPSDSVAVRDHTSSRKDDHVRLANSQHETEHRNAFDDVRFIHHAFPDVAVRDIDICTHMFGATWENPFYINAMTGGSEHTGALNASLADAAQQCGVAIASGSQHAALRDASLLATFTTLRDHTSGFLFANVGPSVTASQARQAVDMIAADALQIHINAAQEIVMPEGDRDFTAWKRNIHDIIEAVDVPVVVKEVGFGMSRSTLRYLFGIGLAAIDVSGKGGTDFITIENQRRNRHEYEYLSDWGESTVMSLLNAHELDNASSVPGVTLPQIIASGGIRNPLDVVVALSLGADAVGVSGHFLHTLIEFGEEGLIEEIERWKQQIRSIMTLLGARSIPELRATDMVITGQTRQDAELLGISLQGYANRSE